MPGLERLRPHMGSSELLPVAILVHDSKAGEVQERQRHDPQGKQIEVGGKNQSPHLILPPRQLLCSSLGLFARTNKCSQKSLNSFMSMV